MAELKAGKRYWFTEAENVRVMEANEAFQKVLDFPTMIERTFLPAKETPDDAPFMLLVEIMGVIAQKYTELKVTNGSIAALGKVLRSMGYEHKKITRGASYRMVMRSEVEHEGLA